MLHFSLLPNKIDWNPNQRFPDSQDLHQMFSEYPDYLFIPWLFNFTLGEYNVYIKKSRNNYNLIVRNFNKTKVPLIPRSGYLLSQHNDFKNAVDNFFIIVKDMIANYKSIYGSFIYGLPF